jgi:cyclopropane-fatty-acyl-phospholipid synthase
VIADRVLRSGVLPDAALRRAIQADCALRLRRERARGLDTFENTVERLSHGPISPPAPPRRPSPELLALVLGPRRVQCGGLWTPGVDALERAEEAMLDLVCRRAGLEDGMEVLDLACGWGPLSGWIAERYPSCRVLAVSAHAEEKAFVDERALRQVDVAAMELDAFDTVRRVDRIFAVGLFEHVCNWRTLLTRMRGWLRPDGRAFAHVFGHVRHPYLYDPSWSAPHFLAGAVMPSDDLLLRFADDLVVARHWRVDGRHYERTANAWLENLDAARARASGLLGSEAAVNEWRASLIAAAELGGYGGGQEWIVSQYLLDRR